jgi:hypothetical protein
LPVPIFPEQKFSLIGKTSSPLHHNFFNVAGTYPLTDSNQFLPDEQDCQGCEFSSPRQEKSSVQKTANGRSFELARTEIPNSITPSSTATKSGGRFWPELFDGRLQRLALWGYR